jgi:hypothetical protein
LVLAFSQSSLPNSEKLNVSPHRAIAVSAQAP